MREILIETRPSEQSEVFESMHAQLASRLETVFSSKVLVAMSLSVIGRYSG